MSKVINKALLDEYHAKRKDMVRTPHRAKSKSPELTDSQRKALVGGRTVFTGRPVIDPLVGAQAAQPFSWDQVWEYLHDYLSMKEYFSIKDLENGKVQVVIKHVETSYVILEVHHNDPDFPDYSTRPFFENARVVKCYTSQSNRPHAPHKYAIHFNAMLFAEGEDPYERDENAPED